MTASSRSGSDALLVERFCERLEQLVAVDSPSGGVEQERVAAAVAAWLEPLGCRADWIDEPDYRARSLGVDLPGEGEGEVLLIGHADTVFPAGTAAERPFARDGRRCTGPGVADMKGGLVLAALALEELAGGERPFAWARLVVCADEEVRIAAPRALAGAAGARAALVFECAREGGELVSRRKGALWRTLLFEGRPAHAGADTARGRSAVSALAAEIVRLERLPAGRPQMTCVVTTVRGGESANSVPARAQATVDVRSSEAADLELAARELAAGGPYDGVSVRVLDRGTWPPLRRSPELAEAALALAAELGLATGELASGGVSDGCWTSALGVPTLDGLGPRGGLDHTPEEWIDVGDLPARVELAARLVELAARSRRMGTPSTRAAGR